MRHFDCLRLIARVALVIMLVPLSASAQERLGTLRSGDTLKVWAVSPRLNGEIGTFSEFRADTLALAELPMSPAAVVRARVPYTALRRVDVRRGTHRSTSRIVVGTLAGIVVGGALGAVIGPALECAEGCPGDLGGLAGFVFGAGTGIVVGGVTGGIIGARRTTRWAPVTLR